MCFFSMSMSSKANSKALGEHFRTNHQPHVPPFTYDEVFFASIHIKDNVTILQDINDAKLFAINYL